MRKTLLALIGAATVMGTLATPASASALETREFVGHGSSDFGLALFHARQDAKGQAERAGFSTCEEYFKLVISPYEATVFWRCTR
ncbi:hypothetical protein [Amycolatopsis regifaucium]|uniref:Uncharacterized protein n=1 Tax=Amycolatopsis regifaucium TaxID=546365 RepID=A0A154MEL3_9PSEU|nr:hypothetical protein [Amycolatopsis regifaucium]KZB82961.1 hypothetical protein AVL48_37005 [Amycolatopsis regifaucium]OKA11337.1 hypothetical protein ATP06_0200255 [Amycolatopsis regifaucium]SFH44287.1 hypothetical protein SAMN04489731_104210 [Amycolatopsis regifaucium]